MEDSSFFCQLCFVFFFIHLSKNSRSLIVGVVGERKRKGREKDRAMEREERGMKVEKIGKEGRGREEEYSKEGEEKK